jgi:hypothetical protein
VVLSRKVNRINFCFTWICLLFRLAFPFVLFCYMVSPIFIITKKRVKYLSELSSRVDRSLLIADVPSALHKRKLTDDVLYNYYRYR